MKDETCKTNYPRHVARRVWLFGLYKANLTYNGPIFFVLCDRRETKGYSRLFNDSFYYYVYVE